MSLRKRDLTLIAKYIMKKFDEDQAEFEDYLIRNITELKVVIGHDSSDEELWERLDSCKDRLFRILEIKIKEEKNRHCPVRVDVLKKASGDYLVRTAFGNRSSVSNQNWMNSRLQQIAVLDDKTKADLYELFCVEFLKDMGVESYGSKSTGDSGVDLVGIISLDANERRPLEYMLNKGKVFIIGQVKCKTSPVDTPVLRHLIADSILYRFDPDIVCISDHGPISISNHPHILCVFSHEGFTSGAYKFAEDHGIRLFSSRQMVNLLAALENFELLRTYRFLVSLDFTR